MVKTALKLVHNKFPGKFLGIPEEYKDELLIELLQLNIQRARILSILLLTFNMILFCVHFFTLKVLKSQTIIFGGFSYLHVSMITVALIFLLMNHFKIKIRVKDIVLFKVLNFLVCMMVLLLCSFIAVRNEEIGKQPFSYIVALFFIASLIYLDRIERIIVNGIPYIFYIVNIYNNQSSSYHKFEYISFSAVLLLLAAIMLEVNYSSYVRNFINNKVIFNKNLEIDNMYRITEVNLKKRTEELNSTVEYEKLRTAFFANISHEFRTPLNVIFSAEQMIEHNIKKIGTITELEGIKQYTNIIRQNCYRLIRLIANFIDITKIDAEYLRADFQNLDIIKIVEDITMSVATYMRDKDIMLIFDTEVEESVIACDPDKIERILLNLLSNAIKFTPKKGSIYVNIYDNVDNITISVKDTGLGIPDSMKESIFERFVQVDKTISRSREGSGIGLSLVKAMVEMHKGSISLISEQGKGSEFIIDIPKLKINCIERKSEYDFMSGNHNIEKINIEFSDIYS